jgi:phage terminase small subunit
VALTKKQQMFVTEYCADPQCGKEEAARRAGFSRNRAAITACELMKNPEVQREIERRLTKKLDKLETTQESVLQELHAIIEAAKEAGAGHWQMQARLKATELLGKYLKMFTEKVEVGPSDALMELLLEGRKRAGLVTAVPALPEGGQGSVN